jgi:hypothetical protein
MSEYLDAGVQSDSEDDETKDESDTQAKSGDTTKVRQATTDKRLDQILEGQTLMQATLVDIQNELGKFREYQEETERRLVALSDKQVKIESSLTEVERRLNYIERKQRERNLRLIGIPESNPEDCYGIVHRVMSELDIRPIPQIEVTHRTGRRGQLPRHIILRVVKLQDKMEILRRQRVSLREKPYFFADDLTTHDYKMKQNFKPEIDQAKREGKRWRFRDGQLMIEGQVITSVQSSENSQPSSSHQKRPSQNDSSQYQNHKETSTWKASGTHRPGNHQEYRLPPPMRSSPRQPMSMPPVPTVPPVPPVQQTYSRPSTSYSEHSAPSYSAVVQQVPEHHNEQRYNQQNRSDLMQHTPTTMPSVPTVPPVPPVQQTSSSYNENSAPSYSAVLQQVPQHHNEQRYNQQNRSDQMQHTPSSSTSMYHQEQYQQGSMNQHHPNPGEVQPTDTPQMMQPPPPPPLLVGAQCQQIPQAPQGRHGVAQQHATQPHATQQHGSPVQETLSGSPPLSQQPMFNSPDPIVMSPYTPEFNPAAMAQTPLIQNQSPPLSQPHNTPVNMPPPNRHEQRA